MTARHRRLLLAALVLGGASVGVGLVLNAFRGNMVFFYSPSDIAARAAPTARTFRLGGLVEGGSVQRQADGVTVRFVVTDTLQRIPVEYRGILPDLFREGKGVVAQGRLDDKGLFVAREVLAKHDENYMPPEAADALERARRTQARDTPKPEGS